MLLQGAFYSYENTARFYTYRINDRHCHSGHLDCHCIACLSGLLHSHKEYRVPACRRSSQIGCRGLSPIRRLISYQQCGRRLCFFHYEVLSRYTNTAYRRDPNDYPVNGRRCSIDPHPSPRLRIKYWGSDLDLFKLGNRYEPRLGTKRMPQLMPHLIRQKSPATAGLFCCLVQRRASGQY